jgi:hypothetical protein
VNDFDVSDGQTYVNDNSKKSTTDFFLGLERRYFEPRKYFAIEAGVRAYFTGIVSTVQPTQVTTPSGVTDGEYDGYGFFGLYALASYDWLLGNRFEFNVKLGGAGMTTGDSSRVSEIAILKIRKRVTDTVGFGFRFEEELAAYSFRNGTALSGDGHELDLFPEAFVEFRF